MTNLEAVLLTVSIAFYLFAMLASWKDCGTAERLLFVGGFVLIYIFGFDIMPSSAR